jgi:hypothetical protein
VESPQYLKNPKTIQQKYNLVFASPDHFKKRCEVVDREVNASIFLPARKYSTSLIQNWLKKSLTLPPCPLKDQPLAFIHLEWIT